MSGEEGHSPLKRYYTIAEVSKILDVSKSLIRFWESRFPQLRPHKTSRGDRRFTKENLELLKEIHQLVKGRGFTLEGAQQELMQSKARREEKAAWIKQMKDLRDFLSEWREQL